MRAAHWSWRTRNRSTNNGILRAVPTESTLDNLGRTIVSEIKRAAFPSPVVIARSETLFDDEAARIEQSRGVSTIAATPPNERIVIRLLDKSDRLYTPNELGMDSETLKRFQQIIRLEHGLILVTGPTGGGKSTTCYGPNCGRIFGRIVTVEILALLRDVDRIVENSEELSRALTRFRGTDRIAVAFLTGGIKSGPGFCPRSIEKSVTASVWRTHLLGSHERE